MLTGNTQTQGWLIANASGSAIGAAYKYGYTNTGWTVTEGSIDKYSPNEVLAAVLETTAINDTDFTLSSNGSEAWVFDSSYIGDVTAVAQWTPNRYHFSFDINLPNDETADIETPTRLNNQKYPNKINLPTLPDLNAWKFEGWSIESSGSAINGNLVQDYVDKAKKGWESGITIPLYAVWSKKNLVNIFINGQWQQARPYIYHNNAWRPAAPYIYSNNDWHQITG
jgi:hypothetical protein